MKTGWPLPKMVTPARPRTKSSGGVQRFEHHFFLPKESVDSDGDAAVITLHDNERRGRGLRHGLDFNAQQRAQLVHRHDAIGEVQHRRVLRG